MPPNAVGPRRWLACLVYFLLSSAIVSETDPRPTSSEKLEHWPHVTRGKQPRDAAEDALLLQALHHSHREATRLLLMAVREGATDAQIAGALRQGLPHLKRFSENDPPTIAIDRQEHENVGGTVPTHPTHANSDADTAGQHHCIDSESGEQTKMTDGGADQWEYGCGQWVTNVTQAQHDNAFFYHEAAANVRRYHRYGWNAWSYDENPRPLGIKAYLLCHIEQRCASAHRMIYAAGFDQVSMAQTHEIEEINLESWVATGKVSSHFNKGNTMEQRLRYVAAAVDHRNIIEMALRQNYSWVAVFEDDIILTTSPSIASTRILGALASLPSEADTLHLEYCYDACKMSLYSENNQWASTAYEPYCSAAIIYSAQGIRKLLGSLDTILTAHDDHIAMRCKTKYLNCFKLRHPVYAQDMYWDSTSVSVRPQTCLGCTTKLRSKQHTLHPDIPLCRESEFGLDFVNHQIHSGEDVAFDNKTPVRELEGRQTQHPEDQLVLMRINFLTEDVSSSLMVSISGLKDTCMYYLEIFVVVYGDQEHIPVLKESRVVVVETGQTGIVFDIDLSGSNVSGVENASKNGKYFFHGTVYDTFPGLSADESVVGAVQFAK